MVRNVELGASVFFVVVFLLQYLAVLFLDLNKLIQYTILRAANLKTQQSTEKLLLIGAVTTLLVNILSLSFSIALAKKVLLQLDFVIFFRLSQGLLASKCAVVASMEIGIFSWLNAIVIAAGGPNLTLTLLDAFIIISTSFLGLRTAVATKHSQTLCEKVQFGVPSV